MEPLVHQSPWGPTLTSVEPSGLLLHCHLKLALPVPEKVSDSSPSLLASPSPSLQLMPGSHCLAQGGCLFLLPDQPQAGCTAAPYEKVGSQHSVDGKVGGGMGGSITGERAGLIVGHRSV